MRDLSQISNKDGVYNKIYAEIFRLHKKYFNAGDGDATAFADECHEAAESSGWPDECKPFVSDLLLAIVNDIERAYMRRRGDGTH